MAGTLAAAQRTADTAGPDVLVTSAAGLLAWAVWAWGALGLALTAASALPGMLGGAARLALHVVLPAGARRSAALALGLGLGVAGPLLGTAALLTPTPAAATDSWTPSAAGPASTGRWRRLGRQRTGARLARVAHAGPAPDWPSAPPPRAPTSSSAASACGTSRATGSSRSTGGCPPTARWLRRRTPGGRPTPTSSARIPTCCCRARSSPRRIRREPPGAPHRLHVPRPWEPPMTAPATRTTPPLPPGRPPLRLVVVPTPQPPLEDVRQPVRLLLPGVDRAASALPARAATAVRDGRGAASRTTSAPPGRSVPSCPTPGTRAGA